MKQFGINDFFNPTSVWNRMRVDPSQIPVQYYPGTGYSYGYPEGAIFGPWPGFYLGSRTLTPIEAIRIAKERQEAAEKLAQESEQPEHRYLYPWNKLNLKELKAKYLPNNGGLGESELKYPWKPNAAEFSVTYPISELLRRANVKVTVWDRDFPMVGVVDNGGFFPKIINRLLLFKKWNKAGVKHVKVFYQPFYFLRNINSIALLDPVHTRWVVKYQLV